MPCTVNELQSLMTPIESSVSDATMWSVTLESSIIIHLHSFMMLIVEASLTIANS
jgi:hypothetical protein